MAWIGKLWRGEIPLRKAFWIFGVTISFVAAVVSKVIVQLIMVAFLLGQMTVNPALLLPLTALWSLAVMGYEVIAAVGIWRSSERYQGGSGFPLFCRGAIALFAAVSASDLLSIAYAMSGALRK